MITARDRVLKMMGGGQPLYWLDLFARGDGPVVNTWIGATCSIVSNRAVITPTLGAEIHTSANAASDPNGNEANATTGWVGSSCTPAVDAVTPQVGTWDLTGTATGTSSPRIEYAWVATQYTWYQFTLGAKRGSQGTLQALMTWAGCAIPVVDLGAAWVNYLFTNWATVAAAKVRAYAMKSALGAIGDIVHVDNLSIKPITPSTTLATKRFESEDYHCNATFTTSAYAMTGLAVNIDDPANPQNGLYFYTNGDRTIYVDKLLAGVRSNLITSTYAFGVTDYVGYFPDALMEVRKAGTDYQFYYRGRLVGAAQTITDSSIIHNHNFSLFSTSSVASFGSFYIKDPVFYYPVSVSRTDLFNQTYTAGQGIIALRFDDVTGNNLYTMVYPLLVARGLVAGFAIPYATMRAEGQAAANAVTIPQLKIMQTAGMEIMVHAKTHGADPATWDEFLQETKWAREDMWRMGFDCASWVQPGGWVGPVYNLDDPTHDGLPPDLTLRQYYPSYMAYNLPPDGDHSQYLLPLGSHYGLEPGMGIETSSLANLQTGVDNVIAHGQARCATGHPAAIDTGGGNISLADFTSFLDYLQTAVTAGTLKVMTPTQMAFARPV